MGIQCSVRLFAGVFVLALVACNEGGVAASTDLGASPSSSVQSSSSMQSSSKVQSSSVASSSTTSAKTHVVSPTFGKVYVSLMAGTWNLTYSSQCTQGTLIVSGGDDYNPRECHAKVNNMDVTVEKMSFAGRPTQITLYDSCVLSCT